MGFIFRSRTVIVHCCYVANSPYVCVCECVRAQWVYVCVRGISSWSRFGCFSRNSFLFVPIPFHFLLSILRARHEQVRSMCQWCEGDLVIHVIAHKCILYMQLLLFVSFFFLNSNASDFQEHYVQLLNGKSHRHFPTQPMCSWIEPPFLVAACATEDINNV